MENKVKCGPEVFSAPMGQILDRLQAFGGFEIIHFGDKVILEDPIESWPVCDCLIAFHSSGYPLEKAEAYAALRKEVPYQELDHFIEEEDFVEVHGMCFWKPFVEKPIHGDDHSIMIYYPSSAGGGMKELFRKIARYLLGKILIDLRNTHEEAISVAELKSNQDHHHLSSTKNEKEDAEAKSRHFNKNDDIRRSSTSNDLSMDQDDDNDKEPKYLDPKYANVKTPERHVRTRLYFTSESHIHSLVNVLCYCNLDESLQEEESLVCLNALERLNKTKELDYMSYIVLRMFENTEKNDSEAASLHQEHTLPIMGPERLQEVNSYLIRKNGENDSSVCYASRRFSSAVNTCRILRLFLKKCA